MIARPTNPTRTRHGFTFVELLVVTVAVGAAGVCLAAAAPPVSNRLLAAKCRARLENLALGATTYRLDNGFYPGQYGWGKEQLDKGVLTGSQLLARALFADSDGANFPKSNYAQYQPDETLATLAGKDNTLADGWPAGGRMAVCYYPSRMGAKGMAQYKESDNAAYTAGNRAGDFAAAIKDPNVAGSPVKDGVFLLIAPGVDRTYFSSDDVTNFKP